MVEERQSVVLYANAICNLKCKYCFINKTPSLSQVDELLQKAYATDYFVQFAHELFPDPLQLRRIEIWGGEPTLSLDRVLPTIQQLLDTYPNISKIMFSTNLAYKNCFDNILSFIQNLKVNHELEISIQLSLDGPEIITDQNRGEGVTKNFLENFSHLVLGLKSYEKLKPNIKVFSYNKATLSIETVPYLLTKQNIITYYQFFEQLAEFTSNHKSDNFYFEPSVPNTAVPQPVTKEQGKQFATLCKLCREIEKENTEKKYFHYYTCITPYSKKFSANSVKYCNCGTCGAGKMQIGMLPNNYVSLCHNGFTNLDECYSILGESVETSTLQSSFFQTKRKRNLIVLPYSELSNREQQLENFYDSHQNNQYLALLGEIQLYANCGIIDSKYKDLTTAIEATYMLQNCCSFCIRDNLDVTGTQLLTPPDIIILLLNGAIDYIKNEDN